jgi:signal transduction histidine kinase
MINTRKESLFWILAFVIFVPRLALFFFDAKLEKSISGIERAEWTIKDKDQKVLKTDVEIGKDLRRTELQNQGYWIYEKQIHASTFANLDEIGIVLGRAGDSDKVFLNDCEVGQTGFDREGKIYGWFWSHLVFYKLEKQCIKEANTLQVHIAKLGGPSYGIYSGPIGVGEYSVLNKIVSVNNFLRYFTLLIYGVALLLFVGTYYIFVYLMVPERKYNGIFGLKCVSIGFFLLLTSVTPFHYFNVPTFLVKLLFTSAGVTAMLFILFFTNKYNFISKKFQKIFIPITGVFLLVSYCMPTLDLAYKVYEAWHLIFLITFIALFVHMVKKYFKGKAVQDYWRYLLAFAVFMACCLIDVAETALGGAQPYMITYGFMFFATAVALSLAKEYADAFLYVESQVGERTKDLSSALEQLRGLEKMKERFFANISHDLKTPITIALGAIDDAKGQFLNVIGRVLEPADRSLHRLQDMVMSILDTVKAESGTLQLEWKSVKLTDFIKNIVENYRALCAKDGIKLEFKPEGFQGLYIPMDPNKMVRVVENLLSNAIKFTKKTPRNQKVISIALHTDQAKAYIYIDDSGIGIPENEREKVFERYFQSSRTNLQEHGGSGIGLSFVTEMLELHNGKISAQESPYHGTRMAIELPLSQNIDNLQSYRVEDTNEKSLRGSLDVEYPPTIPAKINPSWNTMLVAEDNPEVAQIIYSTLKDSYNIYFGENGKRAFEMLEERKYDCILSDIEMPQMTGDELVENIRKLPDFKSIPIIMLSSHGDDETIVKLLNLGANDYVQKPFRREILLSRIRAQINAYKGTSWNTKIEKLQELGQLVSGIGHQGKNRIGRVGSNYPLLIKIAKDLAKKLETSNPDEAKKAQEKIQAVGELVGKGYEQTLDLFKAIDRYASGDTQKNTISLKEVIHDSVTLLEEKIRLKNIALEVVDLENLSFEGYNEFREAVLNIISNAIDAVEEGKGKIKIHGESRDKEIVLTINDNGYGIAKENIDHVFEPFFTSKQVGQGTGLGLYLARDAVELKNQGKLTIMSDGTGKGATVQIVVPKVVPDIAQQRLKMHNVGV